MPKKIIKLHIEEEDFPMLFQIKNENLGDICYEIFSSGYKSKFSDQNQNSKDRVTEQIIRSVDNNTDSIKYDLEIIKKQLNIDDKIDNFSNILEELFGISNNSSKKGRITEDLIYKIIKNKFKDYIVEETRHKPHSGDYLLKIPIGNKIEKIIVEIKNYTRHVDSDELDKLIYDMKYIDIQYALFFSLKSGFVGKKRMALQEFKHNNKTFIILFVPYICDEFNKIESGVIMLEKIIEYKQAHKDIELEWLENRISTHLSRLDDIYTSFSNLKHKYLKLENQIRQNMSEYYGDLRNHEMDLKENINKIWRLVKDDFGEAHQQLLISDKMDKVIKDLKSEKNTMVNRNLINMMEILKKHNYAVSSNNKNIWQIKLDGSICGTMCITGSKMNIVFISQNLTYDFNIKKSATKEIIYFEKLLGLSSF